MKEEPISEKGLKERTYEYNKNDKYIYQVFVSFICKESISQETNIKIIQYSMILGTIAFFSTSLATGWNSPSIPKLRAPDSPVPLTGDESSWVIVIATGGMVLSCYPSAYIMDKYGRKITLLLGVIPLLTGWLMTGLANSLWMLLVARTLFGMSFAFTSMIISVYLGEIASPRIRGYSITTMFVMGQLGVLVMYSVAPYLSIATTAWISMAPPILFLLTFIWMPETPYFLLGKGKREEARNVLVKLRGHDNIDEEFEQIENNINESNKNQGTFRELLSPNYRKGLTNLFIITLVVYFSGYSTIQDYSQTIFSKIENNLEPQEISIILASVSLVSVFIANVAIDYLGRKPLLLISVTMCAICNTIVGVYFNLSERQGTDVSAIGWLPILAIMTFNLSFGIGLGMIKYVMLGEMFPKHLKSIVGGSCVFVSAAAEIIVSKSFQIISEGFGSDVSFAIFAVCLYAAIPFIIWNVPETKGKTFEEILEIMRPKKFRKSNKL